VFATPTQQPDCAPRLQVALFAHLARLGARLREAKKSTSAWLPGDVARVHFLGARPHAMHVGRFCRLPRVGRVAGAGSRGKVKFPRAREGEVRRNPSRLYMTMALPFSPLLPACCVPPPRERPEVIGCESWRCAPLPVFSIPDFGGPSPSSSSAWCRDSEVLGIFFVSGRSTSSTCRSASFTSGSASSSSRYALSSLIQPRAHGEIDLESFVCLVFGW
jgi:hypothetical protein